MPYGWRVVRAGFFGLILFAVSALVCWPGLGAAWTQAETALGIWVNLLEDDPALSGPTLMAVPFYFFAIFWLIMVAVPFRQLVAGFFLAIWPLFHKLAKTRLIIIPAVILGLIVQLPFWALVVTGLTGLATWVVALLQVFFNNPDWLHKGDDAFFVLRGDGNLGGLLGTLWVLIRPILPLAFLLLPLAATRYIAGLKENSAFRQWFMQGKGGMARFAGPVVYDRLWNTEVAAVPLFNHSIGGNGIYLGKTTFSDDFVPRHICIDDDAHLLTIGQPGSGKSVMAIWPNLGVWGGHSIVVDPKGEHTRRYADFLEHYKFKVIVLDPFNTTGRGERHHYNPLDEIDLGSAMARKQIAAISSACIRASSGDNKFWEEAGRLVLDGVIAHVKSKFPVERQTLPVVADLILGRNPATGFADPDSFNELLIEMRMNDAAGGLPQLAAATLDDLGDRARGNVIAELRNAVKWATDPAMRVCLSKSDFKFRAFDWSNSYERTGSGPTRWIYDRYTVFICIPFGLMNEQSRWLRTLVSLSMRVLEERSGQNSLRQVLYVLDELPQYGADLEAAKEGVVTLRSAKVKIWAFVQNINQLKACFGAEGATNFQTGSTIQLFGVNDMETAQWVGERLGEKRFADKSGVLHRTRKGERQEALIEPEEIMEVLGKLSPIQYVLVSGQPPMRLRRIPFRTMTIEGREFKGLPILDYDPHLS